MAFTKGHGGNPYHDAKGKFSSADRRATVEKQMGAGLKQERRVNDAAHMRTDITVMAGETFRGAHHFQEASYKVSSELGKFAVKEGIAYRGRKGGK